MDTISIICVSCLIGLTAYFLLRGVFKKDFSEIWSPMSTISLTYIYYCIVPFFHSIERYAVDEGYHSGYLFHFAALLSFVAIIAGYHFGPSFEMRRWNKLFTHENIAPYGIILFIIAILGYAPFRGFHITFVASAEQNEIQLLNGGIIYYLIFLIDILSASVGLLLMKRGKSLCWKAIIIWIVLCTFLYTGARWRIVVAVIVALTVIHLYPRKRNPNYFLIAVLMTVMFFGFSIMDQTRQYGKGIDVTKAEDLEFEDIKSGAGENYSVYMFSLLSIEFLNSSHTRYYFEPVFSTILMPIPRYIFPNKPNAEYIHEMERQVLGSDTGGAAFLNFVEGYLSFGWIGVILYGLILGMIAKGVWQNYRNNPDSIGAILLLGLFSGVCYCIISRGYLPSTATNVLYAVCLPFWLCSIIEGLKKAYQK